MSRGPRQAGDPVRFPDPCARCGGHHQTAAVWPDGRVCGYCYMAAKRRTGRCRCGHDGVLPGLIDGQPVCRRCSGIKLNVDCRQCGAEGELHSDGRCWRCTLVDAVEEALTDPATGGVDPSLRPLADAIAQMPRPNSGLTWLRQPHVTEFMSQLARLGTVTHQQLDTLPASRTRDHVRGLLVEHTDLAWRDELIVRYRAWTKAALTRLPDGPEHDLVERYIRWQLLRRMNQTSTPEHPTSQSAFLRAKQNVTVAIDLIQWLQTERGTTIFALTQADLDAWQATGPSTRDFAGRFLTWATRSRAIPAASTSTSTGASSAAVGDGPANTPTQHRPSTRSGHHAGARTASLQMTPHRRGTAPTLPVAEQRELIDTLITDTHPAPDPGSGPREEAVASPVSPRDRFLVILVLVFGQSIERVANLTWDHVTITAELVTIRLGTDVIALPAPLDQPLRDLAVSPVHANTASHPNSPWIFRGTKPGQHASPSALRSRLRTHFPARAARLGTLRELVKTTPIAILAEGLGYSPTTLERISVTAGSTFARYVASPRTRRN